jgi:hypothetical protein
MKGPVVAAFRQSAFGSADGKRTLSRCRRLRLESTDCGRSHRASYCKVLDVPDHRPILLLRTP